MIGIRSITALGRPLDLSYPTNRLIALASLTVYALYFAYLLLAAVPAAEALLSAFGAGIALFLCWAIGREIDPAYDWSAFYALPFVLAAALYYGSPDLLSLFFILLLMRFLNRSTGLRATAFDALMLVALGAVLYNNGVYSGLPLLLIVMAIDYRMEPLKSKMFSNILPAALVLMLSIHFLNDRALQGIGISVRTGILIFIVAIFIIYVIIETGRDTVPGDNQVLSLDIRRINLARLFAFFFIMIEMVLKGDSALLMFFPAVLAVIGSAMYHIIQNIKNSLAR